MLSRLLKKSPCYNEGEGRSGRGWIANYQVGMTFRRSTLFMVKEKYLDLDFSNINFFDMKGHDSANPLVSKSNNAAIVQPVGEAVVEAGGV